jgi:hypothetical protein
MKRILIAVIAPIIVFSAVFSWASTSDKEKLAIAAAEKWVGLLDSGNYAASWNHAAEYFKASITQKGWEQAIKAVRSPLGKVISRKMYAKTYRRTIPGAPDGEYVIIQFKTSFENKKSAVETVTPMRDKDGKWRVSGYFIR